MNKKSLQKFRFLSQKELLALLEKTSNEREYIIICILYETGCTVNELVNIRFRDIDFEQDRIIFPKEHSRNHELRYSYVSKKLLSRIRLFYSGSEGRKYILNTRQSQQITTKRIRQIVQGLCRTCGYENVGPQILRYTHIVHAHKKNIPLDAIQRQVGLKRSRAVEIFSQLDVTKTEDAYKRFMD